MASVINKLSAKLISRLDKPGYYGDGGGLWLQVSRTKSKSWIFRFTFSGTRHEMGLGSYNTIDLTTARAKARGFRQMLLEGTDPLASRRDSRAARALEEAKRITFDQCAAAYIEAHRETWKNPKHVLQWENTLATYASPLIGALPVAAVDTDLVVQVLRPIWSKRTETAVRLRGRIEAILDWVTVSKFRQGDNPARWRGHLDNLLAKVTYFCGSHNSQIVTLVERQTRYVMLMKIAAKNTETVVNALIENARRLPQELYKSLTWDRGSEMAGHKRFTMATDIQVYFCDPQNPWQRGSNENTNGLLRQYFPKGIDLSGYSQEELDDVARRLNERPRKTLNYQAPAQQFQQCVASTG